MATIIKEAVIEARPDDVWAALRDFGALHERLVPGFVVGCHLDGNDTRIVTFFNDAVAREVLIGVDDAVCRLAYAVVEGPLGYTHHSASAQVFADGEQRTRFVWITDLLPDELASRTAELMQHGIGVIKRTLESQAAHR
jgi:polyketide cyclase/dehydrase/lipid transport protein